MRQTLALVLVLTAQGFARASSPTDDLAFDAPPFPAEPAFSSVAIEGGYSRAQAELFFRKADGREIGGWRVDLYLGSAPRRKHPAAAPPARAGSKAAIAPASDNRRSPGEKARRPLIIVLPIGGVGEDAAVSFARAFAKAGFAALYLHRPPPEAEGVVLHSLKGTSRSLTEDTANLRRAVAWAARLPQVDPGRIGVMGVSRGAIVTALAAQLDERLSTVLVLGGADLAGLFRGSKVDRVRKMRRKETERARGDFEEAKRRALTILANVDPATRPGRIDPSRTLLINARYDRVIPPGQALALRAAAGGATQVWLPTGHYTSLLFAGRIRKLALAHFRRTLG